MKEIQAKLIKWIINDATENQLLGLDQLVLEKDINAGLEYILGGKEFDNYIETHADDIYGGPVRRAIDAIVDEEYDNAMEILEGLI